MEGQSKYRGLTINVGSRNSQLALIQTHTVIKILHGFYENNTDRSQSLTGHQKHPIEFNVISMTTAGDQILDKKLSDIGSKSLFTKELEVALIDGKVDFVVHSLKDLPTTLPEGCVIGAICKRDDPDDTIVLKRSLSDCMKPFDLVFGLDQDVLTGGKRHKIGTSSQRRIAMLRRCNDQLECINIRGNLNTRLAKLDQDDGEYSAIVLAKAGLDRMGWSDRASETLSPRCDPRFSDWCYAVGQGAIAVECRADDDSILELLAPISDLATTYEAIAERSLMRKLEGGCSVPLGVRASWTDSNLSELSLSAIVLSLDGKKIVRADSSSKLTNEENFNHGSVTRSELFKLTTGILVSSRKISETILANLVLCSELGVDVANKMIDLGCLELMRLAK